MCLIVFAYRQHPKFPFIFAGNRDEIYDRSTRTARFWDSHPSLLAGKDLEGGGTWLGITRRGRFATVTNFRDPSLSVTNGPSRGNLVLDYLIGDHSPEQYMRRIRNQAESYNGFNLLAGRPLENLLYLNNKNNHLYPLEAGIYGLSNHLLNKSWPKVKQARTNMERILEGASIQPEPLFELLYDEQKAPPDELPDTGLDLEQERAVSSIFIETEDYGTRSSTVVMVDRQGKIFFEERYHKPGQKEVHHSQFSFNID
jgi:uncharacterized protein with NRDE domain